MKRTKLLESVAYHEAGHAVAAWRVGVRLHELSMIEAYRHHGRAAPPPYFEPFTRRGGGEAEVSAHRIENMVLVCLSGPEAQRRFFPTHFRRSHAVPDFDQATELLTYLTSEPGEREAYFRLIDIRARNLVSDVVAWRGIEHLAAALLDRVTLGVREIRGIIAAAHDNPNPRRQAVG